MSTRQPTIEELFKELDEKIRRASKGQTRDASLYLGLKFELEDLKQQWDEARDRRALERGMREDLAQLERCL